MNTTLNCIDEILIILLLRFQFHFVVYEIENFSRKYLATADNDPPKSSLQQCIYRYDEQLSTPPPIP